MRSLDQALTEAHELNRTLCEVRDQPELTDGVVRWVGKTLQMLNLVVIPNVEKAIALDDAAHPEEL